MLSRVVETTINRLIKEGDPDGGALSRIDKAALALSEAAMSRLGRLMYSKDHLAAIAACKVILSYGPGVPIKKIIKSVQSFSNPNEVPVDALRERLKELESAYMELLKRFDTAGEGKQH